MSFELIATGFVMGLAGAGHCAVMCGPISARMCRALGTREAAPAPGLAGAVDRSVIVRFERAAAVSARPPVEGLLTPGSARIPAARPFEAGVARATRNHRWNGALVAFLASRIASYAAGGAVVAASVSLLAALGNSFSWLRPFWVLLQVAVLVVGLWLLFAGRQPPWLVSAFERLGRLGGSASGAAAGPSAPIGHVRRASLAGSAWVFMPCGLLQSALVTASLASTPLAGGAVMASFAVASSLGLLGAPALIGILRRMGGPSFERLVTRLAGAWLAAAAAWALWMLSTDHLAAAVCVV
mgnify:CR=1 FL=1